MTNIEKLNFIKTHLENCEHIEDEAFAAEAIEYCNVQIASLEKDKARNAERRAKKAEENAPIIAAITELLNEEGITAADAATVVGVSVQKASSILRGLVTDHVANVQDTKIPKKGSCKLYTKA